MVAVMTGLGAGVGVLALLGSLLAASLRFDGSSVALQGALMAAACGGVFAYVGRNLNTGATLEGETLVVHFLLRPDRRVPSMSSGPRWSSRSRGTRRCTSSSPMEPPSR